MSEMLPIGQTPRPQRRIKNQIDGVLLVDKPQDWTSFDVLNMMKHRFSPQKIGHCGTLDPLATGLLVVLLGKCTKLQDRLMCDEKVYEGAMQLGVETDSEDSTGNVIATHSLDGIIQKNILSAMAALTGDIEQVPPMYSAIKREGTPLYKLARKGVVIDRPPRPVTIFSFEMLSMNLPEVAFRVRCSKGTYVRTLCADLGKKLGCGANMTALRRIQSGHFSIKDACTVDQLRTLDLAQFRLLLSSQQEKQ